MLNSRFELDGVIEASFSSMDTAKTVHPESQLSEWCFRFLTFLIIPELSSPVKAVLGSHSWRSRPPALPTVCRDSFPVLNISWLKISKEISFICNETLTDRIPNSAHISSF